MVEDHRGPAEAEPLGQNAIRLFAGLPYQLGVTAVRVWAVTAHGEVLVHATGGPPPTRSYPLRSGGRVVGRLELSEAGLRTMTLLDPLLPWIGLAVEHVEALAHERRRVAELARLRDDDLEAARAGDRRG